MRVAYNDSIMGAGQVAVIDYERHTTKEKIIRSIWGHLSPGPIQVSSWR